MASSQPTEVEKETAARRAARGAALLDFRQPMWVADIDLAKLNMLSPMHDVLGQLFGAYQLGIARLFGVPAGVKYRWVVNGGGSAETTADLSCLFGFAVRPAEGPPVISRAAALRDAWAKIVTDRRSGRRESGEPVAETVTRSETKSPPLPERRERPEPVVSPALSGDIAARTAQARAGLAGLAAGLAAAWQAHQERLDKMQEIAAVRAADLVRLLRAVVADLRTIRGAIGGAEVRPATCESLEPDETALAKSEVRVPVVVYFGVQTVVEFAVVVSPEYRARIAAVTVGDPEKVRRASLITDEAVLAFVVPAVEEFLTADARAACTQRSPRSKVTG